MQSESRASRLIVAIAALYLIAHLLTLAPSLEDIDSINFALGLRTFDVASHQPHPPGYPVYIALGRVSHAVLGAFAPSLDLVRAEAVSLAFWSAVGGALALVAIFWLVRLIERSHPVSADAAPGASSAAVWVTALLAASPLFWLGGSRPMSDVPGLALALTAQALCLHGATDRRSLALGAFLAGLTAGVRVQTACLTLPLLALALFRQRQGGVVWMLTRPVVALAAGVLVWVVPLVVLSGGLDAYVRALGSQAGEDLAWTGMLWTTPTPRRLVFALWETFVLPWDTIPFGVGMGVLAIIGSLVALAYRPLQTLVVALAFAPYAMFHLVFQETSHVRYAMPTLPAIVWLVVNATTMTGRLAPAVNALVLMFVLWLALPVGLSYAREPHPAFRAIAAMQTASAEKPPAAVHAHYSMRRPLQAAVTSPSPLHVVEPRRNYEWLGPVDYWRNGGRGRLWFLADQIRTDLALFDPQSRRDVTRFPWSVGRRLVMSGTRPVGADWYRLDPPGWFLGEGWGLTPETGGIAEVSDQGLNRRPIEAYIRRRPGPMHILIGGRHFSAQGDPPVIVDVTIEGVALGSWMVNPQPPGANFFKIIDLLDGLPPGDGDYARLVVTARADPSSLPTPRVAIRQFDAQSSSELIYGFDEGWHEAEFENATGIAWRWTSGQSILRVDPPQAMTLRLRGESPLKYFDEAPTVRIRAGEQVVGTLRPDSDFEWVVNIPADAVRSGNGAIAIETDRIYLPGEVEGTGDPRRLGLRLFEIDVVPGVSVN